MTLFYCHFGLDNDCIKLWLRYVQYNDSNAVVPVVDDCAVESSPGGYRGRPNGELYVCVSDDWGDHWDIVYETPEQEGAHIHRVTIDPYTHDWWVTIGDYPDAGGVIYSRDNGNNWDEVEWFITFFGFITLIAIGMVCIIISVALFNNPNRTEMISGRELLWSFIGGYAFTFLIFIGYLTVTNDGRYIR